MIYQVYVNGKLAIDKIWEIEKAHNYFYKEWIKSDFQDTIEVYLVQPLGMSSNVRGEIVSTINYKFNKRENIVSLINYLKEINF